MATTAEAPAPVATRAATASRFSLQQAMLRVKDPQPAVEWFTKHFGMTLIDVKRFPAMQFDLYFLASLADGEAAPAPGTPEANAFLWAYRRTTLELTHNYGTEADAGFAYSTGNVEPHRGFGHVGFIVDDVDAFCAGLEGAGVRFQKRPQDGRMRHIAFVLTEPDGYWVEVLPRTTAPAARAALPAPPPAWPPVEGKPCLQQVMLRIKDPRASVPFYTQRFGMTLVCERHFPDAKFSLYFLATLPEGARVPADPASPAAWEFMTSVSGACLELTHNHGTESDAAFAYHTGNTEPRGFGHVGFIVPGLEGACAELEAAGVPFSKRPHEGRMRGIAFCKDPDGYAIELIEWGLEM